MWFTIISEVDEPGRDELKQFVDSVIEFLDFVLERPEAFAFLWRGHLELRHLARQTFENDVKPRGRRLRNAISRISKASLASHGLVGRPAKFKFRVLNSIANRWPRVKRQRPFAVRRWFKQTTEAIDVILGSLVDAAAAGGIIKEFKDALSALAWPTK